MILSDYLLSDPRGSRISGDTIKQLVHFRDLVVQNNQLQNLTRLTSDEDFFYGHLVDCLEAWSQDLIVNENIDLGSGAGVPGIVCALLEPKSHWILVEAEKSKAGFLELAVRDLGIAERVRVFPGRIEDMPTLFGSNARIFSRAVGKVEKIFPLLRNCSTWNSLLLFKGPGWQTEWQEFLVSKFKRRLELDRICGYSTRGKERVLVLLRRS